MWWVFKPEWDDIFGATGPKVIEVASAAVGNGELFLVPGKNKMGRPVAFLRLTAEKTPAETPAGKTPADDLAGIENPHKHSFRTPATPASLKRERAAGISGPHLSSENLEGGEHE